MTAREVRALTNLRFQKPEIPMSTSLDRPIPVTDDRGRPLLHSGYVEPEPGSVVLVNGEFGCAWQRQFDDGSWRSVRGGRPRAWSWLLTRRNLVLVYDAAVRS